MRRGIWGQGGDMKTGGGTSMRQFFCCCFYTNGYDVMCQLFLIIMIFKKKAKNGMKEMVALV